MVIHLGDGSSDIRDFAREYPEKAIVIKGNCDFSYGMEEYVLEAGGGDYPVVTVEIDRKYVEVHLAKITKDRDLKKYVL